MVANREILESRHFVVERLDDGIFAVIHREKGWAIANSGIIDLGEQSLVFDTFLTVQAATDLRIVAEQLTGNPVRVVINSHYHNDHIWGNQVFDSRTHIISSAETRHLITTKGKVEYDWYKENSATRLKELQSEFANEEDEDRRTDISLWISYYQGLVETFPKLSVRLPNVTFSDRMNIHGADKEIELISFKGGHTGSDTILHVPSKRILFTSDLLFVGCHPYLADGDPSNLISTLDEINKLEPKILVPGHGPVGTKEDLNLMMEYILHCDQTTKNIIEEGKKEKDISNYPIPEKFSSWNHSNFYTANLSYFYEQYRSEVEERR